MLGYLPQVILLALISYSLWEDVRRHGAARRVSFWNTLVGWVAVLVLLWWGGFFS